MTIPQENAFTPRQPQRLDQLSGYIWINGELILWQDATVHVLTHSLHYSGGVFEGEKAYNGKVFKLEEHTHRLIKSAQMLGLNVPYSFDEIVHAHELVIKKNNIQEAYIRPFIWCGSESLNLTNPNLSTNLLVAAVPSFKRSANPLRVHVSRWQKASPSIQPPQCKSSGHYNMMIVCKKEAKSLGFDDAIMLDFRGYIAECTTSNIFFVQADKIVTPIPDTFLNGITRQTIIELAHKLNIEVEEQHISLDMIANYAECFVTGTAIEIQAVKSIENTIFPDHKITNMLKYEYDKLVRE